LPVPLEAARFKFPYVVVAAAINKRDADAIASTVHSFHLCYEYLQVVIGQYEQLLKENTILRAENKFFGEKEMY